MSYRTIEREASLRSQKQVRLEKRRQQPSHPLSSKGTSYRKAAAEIGATFGLAPSVEPVLRESVVLQKLRAVAREFSDRLEYKDVLLREQGHRFANSLQILANTLLSKSRSAYSEEVQHELQYAHHRIISVAALQRHLQSSADGGKIDLQPYLSRLCETLSDSMTGDEQPIALRVHVNGDAVDAAEAVSIGRIATELIINALKHAFPNGQAGCAVDVSFEQAGQNWRLTVSDNGLGKEKPASDKPATGLGTRIVGALAKHLEATVEIHGGANGMTVSVTRGHFVPSISAAVPLS